MPLLTSKSKAFVDISLAWDPNPVTKDITLLINERSINNSLRNLVMIAPSEVPFRNDVGTDGVYTSMFEMNDIATAGLLSLEIERSINYNEPRVRLIDVRVEPLDESNALEVNIQYEIIGYDNVFSVDFILSPSR